MRSHQSELQLSVELAVNMLIDNFDCERTVIKQYVKLQLIKCLQEPHSINVTRLPHKIYLYCHQIFKKEQLVNTFLLQLFEQVFFIKNTKILKEETQNELTMLYRKTMTTAASDKQLFVSQINLRFILLGIAVKLNKLQYKVWRIKMKDYINKLQIELELVLDSQQTLSDILIRQLELMRPNFDHLVFYEEMKMAFEKYEVVRVVNWTQRIMEEKRRKVKQQLETYIPKPNEGKKQQIQNRRRTIKRVTMSQKDKNQITQKEHNITTKLPSNGQGENRTKSKDQQSRDERQSKNTMSCISLANKMRKSGPGPTTRFSSKYVFKSSKKPVTQEIVQYSEHSPSKSPENENPHTSESTQLEPIKLSPVAYKNDQDSNVLCAATPPKLNRKYFE